jgi:hypothetical protein
MGDTQLLGLEIVAGKISLLLRPLTEEVIASIPLEAANVIRLVALCRPRWGT